MSTRSRTRASTTGKSLTIAASQIASKTQRPKHIQENDMVVDSHDDKKENANVKAFKSSTIDSHRSKKSKAKQEKAPQPLDCTCSKGDDGSPMIYCSECGIWYHFVCIGITEAEAEEIYVYICPTCTETTRRRSAMVWEGEQAVEECTDDEQMIATRRKVAFKPQKKSPVSDAVVEESEESPSSEDEYVENTEQHHGRGKLRQRLQRHISTESDTNSEDDSKHKRRRISRTTKISQSPTPSDHHPPQLKRKANVSPVAPPAKKKRSSLTQKDSDADDPVRKYCLTKLEELFRDVFLRYPHVKLTDFNAENMDVENNGKEGNRILQKKLDELNEEEKEALIDESRQFADELEGCIFEIYSEMDKLGNSHAGGKYKDRFRMLQFNLSKVDRVIIHQRITSGNISPKEISLMSSTDLADEETKQSIKLAEKESLEHSILQKSAAPRAKITHKGLQDIEDVNGEVASARETELQKERELLEEERRERERMARLRAVQRQRTTSVSVPPESPIVPLQSPAGQEWGAPPPVPPHAMSPTPNIFDDTVSKSTPFAQSSSETMEPELNLADLINIDEDQDSAITSDVPMNSPQQTSFEQNTVVSPTDMPFSSIPTGISPFAPRVDKMRSSSFDLNSLWNNAAPSKEQTFVESVVAKANTPTPAPVPEEPQGNGSDKDEAMELESVEANDQDFDMFLQENRNEAPQNLIVTPIPSPVVESLPQVWSGKVTMPLDSTVPQEIDLIARQVAGRPLAPNSPLWGTLFPTELLRIEGRVAVENSMKYLVQMRLNAAKELYAVAFVPSSPTQEEDFQIFCNFLISKSRHGLVFPWGPRPKDHHPGRELYMIPLRQQEALPEFVELLDELKLPKTRSRDYLIGIWIINRGKLAPPQAQNPPPVNQLQLLNATPPTSVPMLNSPPPQPQMQAMGPLSNLAPPIPGIASDAALVAEVASLTPEQLQEVLRTLQLPALANAIPSMSQAPLFPHNNPPPSMEQHPPPNLQNWMQHQQPPPPPPGTYFPPPNVPNFQQVPPLMNQPYDRKDFEPDATRPAHQFNQSERGNRGWRGNPNSNSRGRGGRGRGRGDGYDRDFNARRTSDSGWPRRPRNEGQSGPTW